MNSNQVHFTLQGKGGVGKSLISAVNGQYFRDKVGANKVATYDTDPVNDTFSQYAAFQTKRIDILGTDQNINARAFDSLMESLLGSEGIAVVDNGASTFVPLMAYMVENGVVEMLQGAGKKVYIHSVITGGQAFNDTLQGLTTMLETQKAAVVVWQNEFFGEVEHEGKRFEDSGIFKEHRKKIAGVIKIERRNNDTFGKDVELMVKNKMTFDEALKSDTFGIMPRQRLKMVKDALYAQLDAIEF